MWIVYIFLNLVVLHHTVSSFPPSPISVNFSSVNLRNLVQWIPGNGTLADTHFTVQYAIYGDSIKGSKGKRVHWRAVRQCTDIVWRWCDLSNETWDQEQGYYARVRAVGSRGTSKWVLTGRRFDPKTDTSFGTPLVSVEVEDNNAIITLKGPMRYQPDNHTAVISMATLYPQMTYSLFIQNSRHNQTHHFPVVLNPYNYRRMDYETQYCFRAKASLASLPIMCYSSVWHCITTPKDPVTDQLQRAVWGIVVPSLCICVLVMVGYFLRNYLLGKGQKSPGTLNQHSFHPRVTPLTPFPPEKLNLILISVIEDNSPSGIGTATSDSACPKQHDIGPPPRYSSQRPEAPAEPDDLSIDYGVVGLAPKISDGEVEETRERQDRGDNRNNLQKCNEKKELRVKDVHSARDNSPWTKSYLSQGSTHTSMKTLMPVHSEREVSTLVRAQAWASVLLSQIQGSLLSFQGASKEEVDRESLGLFLTRSNQAGLFHVPLPNQQKKEEEGMGENDGKVRVRTDGKVNGAVEEKSDSEKVAHLSPCASSYIPNLHNVPSDFLPKDYGALSLATANSRETDSDKEEEGTICINWDPETRKLLLPEMTVNFKKQGGLGGLMQELEGHEDWMGGEEGEVNATKSMLKLENVFVRQGSEEAAETLREIERRRETGGDLDILTKWDLVISPDQ